MHKFAKQIVDCAKSKVDSVGIDNVSCADLKELGEWIDIAKDLVEYDKNIRIIKAMDEAEEEEKILDKLGVRAGYDRYRYADGRFAPKGHGTRRGYTPYLPMEPDEWINAYLNNPDFVDKNYRMGYHGDKGVYSTPSKHGEVYDRYSEYRRHYHESHDQESKHKMEESMKDYANDVIQNVKNLWADADVTLRQALKNDFTKLVQQMQ
jgi:hypothetical protein